MGTPDGGRFQATRGEEFSVPRLLRGVSTKVNTVATIAVRVREGRAKTELGIQIIRDKNLN